MIVDYEGFPSRIACHRCHCEIHALTNRELIAKHPPNLTLPAGETVASFRRRDIDEPPVYHPDECNCVCHESARRFLTSPYM